MASTLSRISRSLSLVEKRRVEEVNTRTYELDLPEVENPQDWNPPKLESSEVYKSQPLDKLRRKILIKETELRIKIAGPNTQVVNLNIFGEEELKKFAEYVKNNKYSYLHFGGIRIGLAPLFRHGINSPCLVELFDTRHKDYDHARIGSVTGNLASGCQYGTIYPDYSISLADRHLANAWKVLVGVQGLRMIEDSEFVSLIIQTAFQLNNTVHPKLRQPVLRDCVTTGISNAEAAGVSYEDVGLPSDWYFQYTSIKPDKKEKQPKRIVASDGQVRVIPPKLERPIPFIIKQHKLAFPKAVKPSELAESTQTGGTSDNVFPSSSVIVSGEKPFMAKAFRHFQATREVEETWTFNNKRFHRGGRWPPRSTYCTTSSVNHRHPKLRAECAPVLEIAADADVEMKAQHQICNYLSNWCGYAQIAIDELGTQGDLILANLELLYNEQQKENVAKEHRRKEKEEKLRLKEKKRLRRYTESMGRFFPETSIDESYESPTEYSSLSEQFQALQLEKQPQSTQLSDKSPAFSNGEVNEVKDKKASKKKVTDDSFQIAKAREEPEPKNIRGLKLEDAAKLFPDFIRPSVNKAHVVKQVGRIPKIEGDLMATNPSGYVLDLDESETPEDAIRVWVGSLHQIQLTNKLDNWNIFAMAERRMAGMVYDWWTAPEQAQRDRALCIL
jgi:hypothetical protein